MCNFGTRYTFVLFKVCGGTPLVDNVGLLSWITYVNFDVLGDWEKLFVTTMNATINWFNIENKQYLGQ
jgi:hypothetical protein